MTTSNYKSTLYSATGTPEIWKNYNKILFIFKHSTKLNEQCTINNVPTWNITAWNSTNFAKKLGPISLTGTLSTVKTYTNINQTHHLQRQFLQLLVKSLSFVTYHKMPVNVQLFTFFYWNYTVINKLVMLTTPCISYEQSGVHGMDLIPTAFCRPATDIICRWQWLANRIENLTAMNYCYDSIRMLWNQSDAMQFH